MKPWSFPHGPLRAAILESLSGRIGHFGVEPPELRFFYLPRAHARALSLDTMVVQGARGTGKSSWWSALQSKEHRALLEGRPGISGMSADMVVSPGFGSSPSPSHPTRESIEVFATKHDTISIWRAVVLHQVIDGAERLSFPPTWPERVEWVEAHPELVAETMFRVDREMSRWGRRHLIVFDALDRISEDWSSTLRLLRGLLHAVLELRSSRAIRAKAFVRPGLLGAPGVTGFPDAAKILASEVTLTWPRTDLYGLLWQYLANAEAGGDEFCRYCQTNSLQAGRFEVSRFGRIVPEELRRDEALQREVFHAITGPYMGAGPKSGSPYSWLPTQLADALGQITPTSFLTAIRTAAESEPGGGLYPLSHQALRAGVIAAAKIRVLDLVDDYPWVGGTMESLRGATVPLPFDEIAQSWERGAVVDRLAQRTAGPPPRRLHEGHEGIVRELQSLGVFEILNDGRINMPDIYRVGFGLGRRGGVKSSR